MVSARESFGSISSEVQHEPRVLARRLEPVRENPAPLSHYLLPSHLVEGQVVDAAPKIGSGVKVVAPIEPSPQFSSYQLCLLMVERGLVHAAAAIAGEPPRRWEGPHLPSISRTEARLGIKVAVFQHRHPKLPWVGSVCNLAQIAQVELLLRCVKVRIVESLGTHSWKWLSHSQFIIILAHLMLHSRI